MYRPCRTISLALAVTLLMQGSAFALPVSSKTAPEQSEASLEADLEAIHAILESNDVVAALEAHGLTRQEIHLRLAQLSPQEVHQFTTQMELLQAAGVEPPKYIWILLGVFLGVLILVAIF